MSVPKKQVTTCGLKFSKTGQRFSAIMELQRHVEGRIVVIPCRVKPSSLLAKRERKDLDAGIEEFDLEGHVFDRPLLPDELIHPRLSNIARSIGSGIGSMVVAG